MHPNGYHKSEQAKERCWSCSHPEHLTPTAEDEAYARKLIADGYVSTSNRYRDVSRIKLPTVKELLTEKFHGTWLEEEVKHFLEGHKGLWARVRGERITLTSQQFYAFKKAGGRSG